MEKPLHTRIDFIASIIIPPIISAISAATIYYAEPSLSFCFTSECYSNFVSIFKIPITISALAFPLAGIVAAYHRSIETSKQITIAESNNTFSNYIKHRDDFVDYIEGLSNLPLMKGKFSDARTIYRLVFPKNTYTNFDPSFHLGIEIPILKEIQNISDLLNQMNHEKNFNNEAIFEILSLAKTCSIKMTHHGNKNDTIVINFNNKRLNKLIFSDGSPLQHIYEINLIKYRIQNFCNITLGADSDDWNNIEMMEAFHRFQVEFMV